MHHAYYKPRAPLDRYVAFLWTCDTYVASTARERVLPSGAANIVVHLVDTPMHVFQRPEDDVPTALSCALSGARTTPLVIGTALGPTAGVCFKPGGARPFFDVPAEALSDQVVCLEALWGNYARALTDRLREARSSCEQSRVIEQALLQRIRRVREPSAALRESLDAFDDPRLTSVADVNARTGYSPKRLAALYRDEVGLSPKSFWRVRRFRAALRDLEGGVLRGAALAAAYGYCDQAHFLREFRSLAGSTPTDYLKARIVGSDHVSVFG